jgi:hypothetical protein
MGVGANLGMRVGVGVGVLLLLLIQLLEALSELVAVAKYNTMLLFVWPVVKLLP